MVQNIFEKIDQKLRMICDSYKKPAAIIINTSLYRVLQEEILQNDLAQSSGKIRSPLDLKIYNGVQMIPSEVIEGVEVF